MTPLDVAVVTLLIVGLVGNAVLWGLVIFLWVGMAVHLWRHRGAA